MGEALNDAGLSRRHILQSVDASLKRLNTEWIDLYIVHRADALTPLDETLDALDHVVRMGKVRYLGFSNWPAWKAAKALALQRERGLARFVAGQVYYSLAHRDIEREIVPLSLDQGVGLMIWSPLARGLLSGRYDREHPLSGESLFARSGANIERAYDIVPVLRKIARAHNTNAAAVALAWIAARPAIATVIMGASSSDQLKENLAAASFELTAAEHAELNEASKLPPEYPGWFIDFAVDAPLKEALGL
jgi:aryl-alcohol dehydrogenase-like predicted oxidoreductase